LSHNYCVTIGLWIEMFLPLHCWSSSGNGVDWLCVSISNTVVGDDWWISIHWYNVQNYCDVLHLPTGQFWQNNGELPSFNMFGPEVCVNLRQRNLSPGREQIWTQIHKNQPWLLNHNPPIHLKFFKTTTISNNIP